MTTHLTTRSSFLDFRAAMNRREAFSTHGALRGVPTLDGFGRLPDEYRRSALFSDYTVYSYATPIAWHHVDDGWVVPDVSYSVTTSRHQSKIRAAIYDYREE